MADGSTATASGPSMATRRRTRSIYGCAILAVPVVVFLFTQPDELGPGGSQVGIIGYLASLPIMGKLLFGTFLIGVPGILIWSFVKGSRAEFQMMCAAMVLIVFNVVFWTLFEQAGSSLTLFADRNTDRTCSGNWSISAPQTQFFNAFFIVLLAPVFSHPVERRLRSAASSRRSRSSSRSR